MKTSGTTLKLVEKEQLIDNVWAFRFHPSQPLTWTAGQFVYVELPHKHPDSEGTKRWFTVSSAPYEDIIQITTRVTDSTFKQALAALPVGGKLSLIDPPDGDFIWQDSERPVLYVAGGIGVTPFRSILRQRTHDHLPIGITLVYGSRTPDVPFKDEIAEWSAADPHFKVDYVVGEPLTAVKLAEVYPELYSSLVYISGPEPLVESLGDQLRSAGLPEAQLKQDFFPNYDQGNY
jgi:ferredoxin-NADP reductase